MTERLDIIILGATGFTGKYTVEELHRITKQYEKNLTWGIAGRSINKMESILQNLTNKTGDDLSHVKIINADIKNEDSLKEMASQCKVVINCCGPYRFYGEPVVKACIEAGTHHVDVSGEPAYMEKMQLKYNEAAQDAGVYVVSACGIDSIPADLGTIFLQQNFKGEVNSVETFMRFILPPDGKNNVVFNYATWESLINGVTQVDELKALRKQLFMMPLPKPSPLLKQRPSLQKNETDNQWYVPFFGADRSVVNRTQRFLYENNDKRPVQMHGYISLPSLKTSLTSILAGIIISFLTKYSYGKNALLKHPEFFSFGLVSRDGPDEESIRKTRFVLRISGDGWDENKKDSTPMAPTKNMIVEITGVNPAYGATCTAVIYSAITILKESHLMPGSGGVLTPGAAFGNTSLVEKLTETCMNFKVVSIDKIKSKL